MTVLIYGPCQLEACEEDASVVCPTGDALLFLCEDHAEAFAQMQERVRQAPVSHREEST